MAAFKIACLLGTAIANVANAQTSSASIALNFPDTVAQSVQIIDGAFQSFSIEFAYMADFAGNQSHPNKLSYNLLKNLATLSGNHSYIRAGGSSGNLPTYNANQATGVILGFASATADQPNKVTLGPAWYQSFTQFPAGTNYIYQLNYRDDSTQGVSNTIAEAKRAFNALGSSLSAYELGNEMEGWGSSSRSTNWSAATYVQDWLTYTSKIGPDVFGANEFPTYEPRFQAGVFESLGGTGFSSTHDEWNAEYILQQGIDKTGRVRSTSIHEYMGSQCSNAKTVPTLADNVMNHDRVKYIISPHISQSLYTVGKGVLYTLGETNSISCQGKEGISNVFGAALWIIDYQLWVCGYDQYRSHVLPSRDAIPVLVVAANPVSRTPRNRTSPYYGNLFVARLLQGGNKQISILTDTTRLTTYGVYTAGKLTDIAIINLNLYNETSKSARAYTKFVLSDGSKTSVVRRLTAPGCDVKTNITFAGVSVNVDGTLTVPEKLESLASDGSVLVGESEAVLVTL